MIILIRHGQTEWNVKGQLQGSKNSALTDLGKRQADNIAGKVCALVKDYDFKVIVSPLGRAIQTAEIITSALGVSVDMTIVDPLLREQAFGFWEGMTYEEIKTRYPDQWESLQGDSWNYAPPGGESYRMISDRAAAWFSNRATNEVLVVISHLMMSKVIRGVYLGLNDESTMGLTHNNNEIIVLDNGKQTTITM